MDDDNKDLTNISLDPTSKKDNGDVNVAQSSALNEEVPFTPYDHTTAQVPVDPALSAFGGNYGKPPQPDVPFFEGAIANWKNINYTWQLGHGGWDETQDYLEGYKDPNFNPLQYADKFIDVKPEYMASLLASENVDQMNFRLKRILEEQALDDSVKNSTWMQWIVGGGIGLLTDPINYIPIISSIKYASLGKTAIRSIARALPGGIAFGALSSLAEQTNKVNGNLHDFLVDSTIRSVFATALFGGGPVVGRALDEMQLWNLRSYVADATKGIGYKIKVGSKGEVEGLEAYDMTPNGSVGADRVQLAQDKADTLFYRAGLFKIPYIGKAAEVAMSNRFIGSPALSMLLSPFHAVRTAVDLAYDHGIITKGLAEGKEKPITFFTLMSKTAAHIRKEQTIFNALHMERNGIDSKNYVAQTLYRTGLSARQKSLEMIEAEIGNRPYITPDKFAEEVQQVMHSGESHDNAAVNTAASMFRKSMDEYYLNFRKAYNLPEEWLPPITAKEYLTRVYDTNYLNNNMSQWVKVISNELRLQDEAIIRYSEPITRLEQTIKDFEELNTEAVRELAAEKNQQQLAEIPKTRSPAAIKLSAMKKRLKAMKEKLQDEIRENPDMQLLADDWHALSAKESKVLKGILKPINAIKKDIKKQRALISELKAQKSKQLATAKKSKTAEKAKPKAREFVSTEDRVAIAEQKLRELQNKLSEAEIELNTRAANGEIDRRLFTEQNNIIKFKNTKNRLKFRDTYHKQKGFRASEEEAHGFRKEHAEAYYHTIMNQTAEDTINQIMSRFTGNASENPLKARSINIRDQVLYDNNFLTKDLLSKIANYKIWLSRRTNLKNVYGNVTLEGGFDNLVRELQEQFTTQHKLLNIEKDELQSKLKDENTTTDEKKQLEKGLKQVEKSIKQLRKDFNRGKLQMKFAYEKMMGISHLSHRARSIVSGIRSFNVFANLGFLPATMITDLFTNGLKQGLVPFIQAGIYPTIESLFGLLKTHDSEAFRKTFAGLNLGLYHVGNTITTRQMDLAANPSLNLGRIPAAMDQVAHFASNINLTNSIDNYLQQLTSSVAQHNVIAKMVAFSEGKLPKADRMWLNRYGLNPEKDADRILAAFKKDGGGTTKIGGYQSNFWMWEDKETANKVGDAVYRSTYDTIINANALDSPIWMDENGIGIMGPIIRGFRGWAFASLNRYLIPTLQQPDAEKLIGFALMTASAALVSPTRRMARGQDPYRPNQTKEQIIAEILLDSPQFSWMSQALSDANLLMGGDLLRGLRNDKYYDRTRIGLLGPTASNANKLFNFVDAMATGNMNQQDVMGMASMIPIVNSLYGYNASQNIIKGFGLPKYRQK